MIEIRYDRKRCAMTLKGHAGAGVYGQDLVCCAVSMLVYTLAANLRRMQKNGWLRKAVIRLAPGDAELGCIPHPGECGRVQARIDAICMGFGVLAREYPEFIRFLEEP